MDEAEARALLERIHILKTLPASAIEELAGQVAWRKIARRKRILAQLDSGASVFFLAEGRCQASMIANNGRILKLRQLQAGAHFGELAALTGAPRSVHVTSESECLIGECAHSAFEGLFVHVEFAKALAASLARSVVTLTDRLFEVALLEVRFRIYAELLRLAKHGKATEAGVMIDPSPNHADMGAAIGSPRETISRELSWLERQGLILRDGKTLLICDVAQLRSMMQRWAGATVSHAPDWDA